VLGGYVVEMDGRIGAVAGVLRPAAGSPGVAAVSDVPIGADAPEHKRLSASPRRRHCSSGAIAGRLLVLAQPARSSKRRPLARDRAQSRGANNQPDRRRSRIRPAGVVRWAAAGRPLPHDYDIAAAIDDVAARGPKQPPRWRCRSPRGCCSRTKPAASSSLHHVSTSISLPPGSVETAALRQEQAPAPVSVSWLQVVQQTQRVLAHDGIPAIELNDQAVKVARAFAQEEQQ
jgi:hypothetical protein